jgi:hypothetical protein
LLSLSPALLAVGDYVSISLVIPAIRFDFALSAKYGPLLYKAREQSIGFGFPGYTIEDPLHSFQRDKTKHVVVVVGDDTDSAVESFQFGWVTFGC